MKKLILLTIVGLAVSYVILSDDINVEEHISETVEKIKNSQAYERVLFALLDDETVKEIKEERGHKEPSEEEKEEKAVQQITEYAPRMDFRGVMRQDGDFYALIGDDLYGRHDFIGDYRLIEVNPGYIVVQGRTRKFRYNLN